MPFGVEIKPWPINKEEPNNVECQKLVTTSRAPVATSLHHDYLVGKQINGENR